MEVEKTKFSIKNLFKNQIMIPITALIVLILFNLIADPSFFAITFAPNSEGTMVFGGQLVTIIDYGSELALLAMGMTLVTAASGGQDISVGAGIAVAGSMVLKVVCGGNNRPDHMQAPLILGVLAGILVAMLIGAFNGILVAYFKIMPMVATLIMFTAGRSIASWFNNNELPIIVDPEFGYIGNTIPGCPIPSPVLVAILCMVIMALVLKFTNLKLYVQTAGINERSARLNGLNPTVIKFATYVILGVFVGIAGFVKVSRLSTINYNVIAKDIEMDAILAVALGGNALGGGKFSIAASVIGAYVIQFLTMTLYKFDVSSEALPAYKAIVVIILVISSAPAVREFFANRAKKLKKNTAKEVA
ncbi:MAG: ABC transporter permease [Lachnospiraceae bacterium]|nr:ABC transporter permease [Lachnospiraceae bacterium]